MAGKEIKINASDVQIGMYVSRLDKPWLETPFMLQGFMINDKEDLELLRKHCDYCFIDSLQTKHFDPKLIKRPDVAREDVKFGIKSLSKSSKIIPSKRIYKDKTKMTDELANVRQTHNTVVSTVKEMMTSLRYSKKLDIESTRKAIKPMVDSIIRNPDALLWLNRLRKLDDYNYSHALGCSILAMSLGRQLGMNRGDLESLGLGALLLDVGKTRLPQRVLSKSERLTDDELKLIKTHVKLSMDIIKDKDSINIKVLNMVETHHERMDGSGYPHGLKNEAIPLFGRIAAIVDCYDAITSDRSYAKPLSSQEAVKRLYEWRGKEFQKELVEEFIQAIGVFPAGTLVELSNGEVGVVITESRTRRLRPKVMLLLNKDKTPREDYIVCNLLTTFNDEDGKPLNINNALPDGSYDIKADDYFL